MWSGGLATRRAVLVHHRESLTLSRSTMQVNFMSRVQSAVQRDCAYTALGVLLLVAAPCLALDESADLGAALKVTSTRPISAELTLVPRVAFHKVAVELPNAIEAAPLACQFGEVVAGRHYRCTITGTTAAEVNALAVAVTGERAGQPAGLGALARKLFMIPNPDFDRVKLRAQQDQNLQRKGRLSSPQPQSQR